MKKNFFLEIIHATYIKDYKLHVVFNNEEEKTVDFYNLLFNKNYPAFFPLRELKHFRNFKVTDTLEWENGTIDIAPEKIYEMGETIKEDRVAEAKVSYNTKKKHQD